MIIEAALVCLATNIYHEARGESYEGQLAVAQVTLNRVESTRYPDNVCDVVYQPWQFSWTNDHISDEIKDQAAYKTALMAASQVMNGHRDPELTRSTHYHTHAVNPKWATASDTTYFKTIGEHRFYHAW